MIDFYSLEKMAESYRVDAEKTAAQDRLAAQAEAGRKGRRAAPRAVGERTAGGGLAARLRALVFAGARRLDTAAGGTDG